MDLTGGQFPPLSILDYVRESLHSFYPGQAEPGENLSVNYDAPYSRLTQDFGIVARFFNSGTGQMQVIVAGIGENGTISAGGFLTDPRFLAQIAARGPSGWEHKNLEAVIATQVIDEKSTPPRLLAIQIGK